MHTEFEVKFLDIDHVTFRKALSKAGAKLVNPERLMRRKNFDFPDQHLTKRKSAWVRVRDEGGMVTLSYKQIDDYSVTGTQEINVTVDDFDTTTHFLQAIGMKQKSYQETKRESWQLRAVQIELETWPWIPTFIELEGQDERSIKQAATDLNLSWAKHRAGDASTYQLYYDITLDEIVHTELLFSPIPPWLQQRRRTPQTA
jgi:adenylate cyclase class 2